MVSIEYIQNRNWNGFSIVLLYNYTIQAIVSFFNSESIQNQSKALDERNVPHIWTTRLQNFGPK